MSKLREVFNYETLGEIKRSVSQALRLNLFPGIGLFALEVALILLYFKCIPCSVVFSWLAEMKYEYGYLFSAVATSFFGGFLPSCIGLITNEVPRDNPKLAAYTFIFLMTFWAILGMWVDAFYKFQAWLWGDDGDWQTVAKKVAFDLFVYNPFFAIWLTTIAFHWRTCDFKFHLFWETLTAKHLIVTGGTNLILTWAIWIPSCSVVYSLPSDLQIPVFNIILCFYNLIILFITKSLGEAKGATEVVDMSDLSETTPLVKNKLSV